MIPNTPTDINATTERAPLYLRGWALARTFRKIVRTILWYAGLIALGFYFVTGQLKAIWPWN